jgi:hypothetical protein
LIRASGMPGDGKTRIMLENLLTRAFGTKAVDFDKHMLLVVNGGAQKTGGYRVEVSGVELDETGKALTVHWKLHGPEMDEAVAQQLSHPAAIVLLGRFGGEVKLEPPATTEQKPAESKK